MDVSDSAIRDRISDFYKLDICKSGPTARDIYRLLTERIAFVSGGRDNSGRAIISFPSKKDVEKVQSDHLCSLLKYLFSVVCKDAAKLGFSAIVDMRRSKWDSVKYLLKSLQECSSDHTVHIAYIIKPDNFIQKQKANFGLSNFKFETMFLSLDNLHKYINVSQITIDFDGVLSYDHQHWIEQRIGIEDFYWKADDVIEKFGILQHHVTTDELDDTLESNHLAILAHKEWKAIILNAPIESMDLEGKRLLQRIMIPNANPDFYAQRKTIEGKLQDLHGGKQTLMEMWEVRNDQLQQCRRFLTFSADCFQTFTWLNNTREMFLINVVNIGTSHAAAVELSESHQQFVEVSELSFKDIRQLVQLGHDMIARNHYASPKIKEFVYNLELEWEKLKNALEERTFLLAKSSEFHLHVEQFLENQCQWTTQLNAITIPMAFPDLCTVKTQLEEIVRTIVNAYNEVSSLSKTIIGLTQTPEIESNSLTFSADFTKCSEQLVSLSTKVLWASKDMEAIWKTKSNKINMRIHLELFDKDIAQVINWIDTSGGAYLKKNTGYGKSFARAKALLRRHEEFEKLARSTYDNAHKLMEAAEVLKNSGEGDSTKINQLTQLLETKVKQFCNQVSHRRKWLIVSMDFYTHIKEFTCWYDDHTKQLIANRVSETYEGVEEDIRTFETEMDATIDAALATRNEGEQLLEVIRHAAIENGTTQTDPAYAHILQAVSKIDEMKRVLDELWASRKYKLNIALMMRSYEKDCVAVTNEIQYLLDQLDQSLHPDDPDAARQFLQNCNENMDNVRTRAEHVQFRGKELHAQLEQTNINIMGENEVSAQERIKILQQDLSDKFCVLSERSRWQKVELEQCVLLKSYQNDYKELVKILETAHATLDSAIITLGTENEAEKCRNYHDSFHAALEKMYMSVKQVQMSAEMLIGQCNYDVEQVKEMAMRVMEIWHILIARLDERMKLLKSILQFYRTYNQVYNTLEGLEKQYSLLVEIRDSRNSPSAQEQLRKHDDQKEQFLKACTLARKSADIFLKQAQKTANSESQARQECVSFDKMEMTVREKLRKLSSLEDSVLKAWNHKKSFLDHQYYFSVFETNAARVIEWIEQDGRQFLNQRPYLQNADPNEMVTENNEFRAIAKDTRERVMIMMQVCEKVHPNWEDDIRSLTKDVVNKYDAFAKEADAFNAELESIAAYLLGGVQRPKDFIDLQISKKPVEECNISFPMQQELRAAAKGVNEEKTKHAKKRAYIMSELLSSEKTYVDDLHSCIKNFLYEMQSDTVPPGLYGKESAIFINIENIYEFHSSVFLRELEKYSQYPEDVGHCFVTWADRLGMYVEYITKQPNSNDVILQNGLQFFDDIKKRYNLAQSIQSCLIKPVQRIVKYKQLLENLYNCCEEGKGEIREAIEIVSHIPSKANGILKLRMLEGYDGNVEHLGDLILQDYFHVWDPRSFVKKVRDRHLFLFEDFLIFSKKDLKDSATKERFVYKTQIPTRDIKISEHVEGDLCKFGIYTGTNPNDNNKLILKASDSEIKQRWVSKLREAAMHVSHGFLSSQFNNDSIISQNYPSASLQEQQSSTTSSDPSNSNYRDSKISRDSNVSTGDEVENEDFSCERVSLSSVSTVATSASEKDEKAEIIDNEDGELLESATGTCVAPSDLIMTEYSNNLIDGVIGQDSSVLMRDGKRRGSLKKWLTSPVRKISNARLSVSNLDGALSKKKPHYKGAKKAPDILSFGMAASSGSVVLPAARLSSGSGDRVNGSIEDYTNCSSYTNRSESHDASEGLSSINSSDDTRASSQHSTTHKSLDELTMSEDALSKMESLSLNSSRGLSSISGTPTEHSSSTVAGEIPTSPPSKKQLLLQELAETERTYLESLNHICQGYMVLTKEVPMPSELKDRIAIVFGNIQQIYEWHQMTFSKDLVYACLENASSMPNIFIKNERKMMMYFKYCQNYPKAEYIVSEHIDKYFEELRSRLGIKKRLSDLLIEPVQRLMRYKMLLTDIIKQARKNGEDTALLERACQIMTEVPKRADDMMSLGRLEDYDEKQYGHLTAQGTLMLQLPVQVANTVILNSKKKKISYEGEKVFENRQIFFFEFALLIAEVQESKNQFVGPRFIFKRFYSVNAMSKASRSPDSNIIELRVDQSGDGGSHRAECCELLFSDSEKAEFFYNQLKKTIDSKNDFARALQAPIEYQKKNQSTNLFAP